MYEFLLYNQGNLILHKTIKYLNDRYKFQNTRWLPDLRKAHGFIPMQILWGYKDDVAPAMVAKYLKMGFITAAMLSFIEEAGHFPE